MEFTQNRSSSAICDVLYTEQMGSLSSNDRYLTCYIPTRRRAVRQRDDVFDSESKDPALLVNITELRLSTAGYWSRSSGMQTTFIHSKLQPSSLSLWTAPQYRQLSFKKRSIAKWSQRYQTSYISYLPITDSILVEPSQVPNFIQSISLPL